MIMERRMRAIRTTSWALIHRFAAILAISTPAAAQRAPAGPRGSAAMGPVERTGGHGTVHLPEVTRILRGNIGRARACFERALAHDTTLHGRVVVRITIARDGTVQRASAEGMHETPDVAPCVGSAVRALQFPLPEGGPVQLTFAIDFSPQH
jgi:hypothetical protein